MGFSDQRKQPTLWVAWLYFQTRLGNSWQKTKPLMPTHVSNKGMILTPEDHLGGAFKLWICHITRQKGYMVQLQNLRLLRQCRWYRWFSSLHVLPKQRSRQWRTESVNCVVCVLSLFPPAFKILRLWIYFAAKISTFHLFTVTAIRAAVKLNTTPFWHSDTLLTLCSIRLIAMSRDSCRVYVGDLGSGGSKPELEREFERYGPLKSVWVARNPPGEKICTAPKSWLSVISSCERLTVWCSYLSFLLCHFSSLCDKTHKLFFVLCM